MIDQPSTNGPNGRDAGGRFAPGNKGGPGNPHARKVAALRTALLDAVTTKDIQAIVGVLVQQAKAGDVASIRELFQRLLGPPEAQDVLHRLEELEIKLGLRESL